MAFSQVSPVLTLPRYGTPLERECRWVKSIGVCRFAAREVGMHPYMKMSKPVQKCTRSGELEP